MKNRLLPSLAVAVVLTHSPVFAQEVDGAPVLGSEDVNGPTVRRKPITRDDRAQALKAEEERKKKEEEDRIRLEAETKRADAAAKVKAAEEEAARAKADAIAQEKATLEAKKAKDVADLANKKKAQELESKRLAEEEKQLAQERKKIDAEAKRALALESKTKKLEGKKLAEEKKREEALEKLKQAAQERELALAQKKEELARKKAELENQKRGGTTTDAQKLDAAAERKKLEEEMKAELSGKTTPENTGRRVVRPSETAASTEPEAPAGRRVLKPTEQVEQPSETVAVAPSPPPEKSAPTVAANAYLGAQGGVSGSQSASSINEAQKDPRFVPASLVEDARVKIGSLADTFTFFSIPKHGCLEGHSFVMGSLVSPFDGLAAGSPVVLRLADPSLGPAKAGNSMAFSGLRRAGKAADGTFVYCGKGTAFPVRR